MAWGGVKQGLLVCNPINADKNKDSTGIAVMWKDDTIYFLDSGRYHQNKEFFIKEGELWTSYCKSSYTGGELAKNSCSNAGKVSIFTGSTLVKSRVEYRCRNVE